ncbi:MAG: hypothetical protein MI864_06165, partial [Pseudomonadales bacterium]|nr:hypothetical protein [Pseudomonadales bacterium]
TCKRMRKNAGMEITPIVFLTHMTGLGDRIKAYDAGGDDHLSKPCDHLLLRSKVDVYDKIRKQMQSSADEAKCAISALLNLQSQSSKVHCISRFVQAARYCRDVDRLLGLFLSTAREIGVQCILETRLDGVSNWVSTKGPVSVLEKEILECANSVEKIHQFGQHRAIFHWPQVSMLVLHVEDSLDILALFMDSLDAALKAIRTEAQLLERVNQLEKYNSLVSDQVTDLFEQMRGELTEMIVSLGLVAALEPDEQDRFNDMLERYDNNIRDKLRTLSYNNSEIRILVSDLRSAPEDIEKLLREQHQFSGNNKNTELF